MYQILTKEEIARFLRGIFKPGGMRGARAGLSKDFLARHLGIPSNTLRWYRYPKTAAMSPERQRALSQFIGMWENGLIDTEGVGQLKRLIRPEKPKPRLKYQVSFGKGSPTLKAIPRPAVPVTGKMPRFKDLLGG